jgi:hypothetical protein
VSERVCVCVGESEFHTPTADTAVRHEIAIDFTSSLLDHDRSLAAVAHVVLEPGGRVSEREEEREREGGERGGRRQRTPKRDEWTLRRSK